MPKVGTVEPLRQTPYLVCLTCNKADGELELGTALGDVCKGPPKGAAAPDTHGALIHQGVCLESCYLWPVNSSCLGAFMVHEMERRQCSGLWHIPRKGIAIGGAKHHQQHSTAQRTQA